MKNYIDTSEKNILKTYNRMPVVFKYGKDVYLYDENGKEYLDFLSGIGVIGLGYSNSEFISAINNQVDRLLHTSNLFYTAEIATAAEKLIKFSGMSKVFFTNSGAEAIEGALKVAKKYAYEKRGEGDYEIIAFNKSFHGRTLGSLSVTGNEDYRKAFIPSNSGVKFAELNDINSVKELVNNKTIAIIVEPIQGEGGINITEESFLKELEKICNEKDILLILDEIQCGVGRTGSFYRYQKFNISPDVVTSAKALGNGIPVGAFLLNEKAANSSLKAGDHGTTYGGNPLAGRAISTVLDIFEKDSIIENVNKITPYFENELNKLVEEFDFIIERKGEGLLQGLKLDDSIKAGDLMKKALEYGLVVTTAEGNILRFLPPLIIKEKHVDEMIEKLKNVFK